MSVPHVGSRTIEEAAAPKWKKGKTMVITDTPNLKELENNLPVKDPIIDEQKQKVVKKQLFISRPRSNSSSEIDPVILSDSSDNNGNNETEENHQIKKTLNLTGKYVIAKFQADKTIKHFVGIVLNSNNEVKFMRKYKSKLEDSKKVSFVWPKVEVIYKVEREDVCVTLPNPTEDRRGRMNFKGGFSKIYNLC